VSSTSFFEFLEQSLAVLRDEMPAAHAAFVSTLEGRRLRIEADGERRVVSFGATGMRAHGGEVRADLEVGFERSTVLDLVDGMISLPAAVLADRLKLRGGLNAIALFDRAFRSYAQGTVRCPSMSGLLDRFREKTVEELR
jgi:hypothetical protein